MSFVKREYVNEETVITAENLNDIQTEIIEHKADTDDVEALSDRVDDIEDKIPAEATSSNVLADKQFVTLNISNNINVHDTDVSAHSGILIKEPSTKAQGQVLTYTEDEDGNLNWLSEDRGIDYVILNGVPLEREGSDTISVNLVLSDIATSGALSDALEDTSHKTVSNTEKTTWNNKYSKPNDGIPKSDLSNSVQSSLSKADSAIQDVSGKADKSEIPVVIDNVTSTSSVAALSAKQGKELNDRINNLQSIGRFLALWDCTTGLPLTDPIGGVPYSYHTGDYYRINKVGTTNYMPFGSTYEGQDHPSRTTYGGEVAVTDIWFYDGAHWSLQVNHSGGGGGGGGTIVDVLVHDQSVVSAGIAYVPVASASELGVIKTNSKGIDIDSNGDASLHKSTDSELVAKTNNYNPIVPSNLDKAVMEGLGSSDLTWSEQYQANARETIGALGFNDITILDGGTWD